MKLYDICVVQVCKNMWFNVKLKFERSRNDKFLWIRLFDFTVFNFNSLYFVFYETNAINILRHIKYEIQIKRKYSKIK